LMYKEIEASVQFIKTYKFPELDLK
jgi:hypothetical protein